MKLVLKLLFALFICWIAIGIYLLNTENPTGKLVMGLCVCYWAFVLMPVFIFHRYKNGKYKKYVINADREEENQEA